MPRSVDRGAAPNDRRPTRRSSHRRGTPSPIHIAAVRSEPDRADRQVRDQLEREIALELKDVSCYYGSFRAVRDVDLRVAKREVTALIGPSGCGKTTLLRTINRMNDLIPTFQLEGQILLDGQDLYAHEVDPVAVRRRVGMVFQKPNPFPKSIFDNVAFGPGSTATRANMDELVETEPPPGGALGRGQGQAQAVRPVAVGRPAAAPVHRAGDRHRAGDHPHGRAVLGARSARDPPDRGAHGRAQERRTRSSSSPTTCSRPPAPRTRPCS